MIFYSPGEWLLVVDDLKSDENHDFTQWFHFHPEFNLINDGNESYIDLSNDKRLWISSFSLNCNVKNIIGQTEPTSGWTSLGAYSLEKNHALGFSVENKPDFVFASLLAFQIKMIKFS